MNKALLALLLLVMAVMVGGCTTETENNDVVVNYNTTKFSVITNDNISNTIIVEENKNLTVTGKIIEINFRRTGDIIIFEDSCVLSAFPAKRFIWKIGEVHQIKMEKGLGGNYIKSVRIIEVVDK